MTDTDTESALDGFTRPLRVLEDGSVSVPILFEPAMRARVMAALGAPGTHVALVVLKTNAQLNASAVVYAQRDPDDTPAAAAYRAANPLGGPANVFRAIADRIQAGDDIDATMADMGVMWAPRPTPEPKGGPLAKLAGQWCNEPNFVWFIRPIYDRAMGGDGTSWGDVRPDDFPGDPNKKLVLYLRHCICILCDIKSRRELDHDARAAALFHALIREPYIAYLKANP